VKYKVKSFGIAKDIIGDRSTTIETDAVTVGELRSWLVNKYPELLGLRSLFIAVNQNYADENSVINETDEIVLIPPVSGG
jgi:molybdopterin synthase sulfur carrier subunit